LVAELERKPRDEAETEKAEVTRLPQGGQIMPENDAPVNKVQTIRDFLAQHPDAGSGCVAEGLTTQVIQVSPTFVSTVRAMLESPTQPVTEPVMPPRHLPFEEGKLFYKLYAALCSYANGKLKLVLGEFSDPEQFTSLPPEIRLKVRDALHAQPELIDQFVQDNPAQLPAEELAIVASWRHAVIGNFYVFRYLKQYAVFLTDKTPPKAYGVLALASPFEEVVGPHLPVLVKGVLLPIHGRIIYDGLLSSYRISFGPGIRRSLNENFKVAKATFGIIPSLPEGQSPPVVPKKAPRKKPSADTADVKAVMDGRRRPTCLGGAAEDPRGGIKGPRTVQGGQHRPHPRNGTTLPVQGHLAGHRTADLAADSSQGLHPGQAP
jgi:hypothetical protein